LIPWEHVLIFALAQFTIGLLGLLLRRPGMVVLVSSLVMLNGVLLALSVAGMGAGTTTSAGAAEHQVAGVVFLALLVALALTGASVLYAFHRFRRTVSVDEHDRMKH
jgi:NADH:ubiquinone oxidoreductase subunit K